MIKKHAAKLELVKLISFLFISAWKGEFLFLQLKLLFENFEGVISLNQFLRRRVISSERMWNCRSQIVRYKDHYFWLSFFSSQIYLGWWCIRYIIIVALHCENRTVQILFYFFTYIHEFCASNYVYDTIMEWGQSHMLVCLCLGSLSYFLTSCQP